MKWLFIAIVAGVAAMLVTLMVATRADATPLLGNRAACEDLGALIVQAGDMRDNGVPWSVALERLQDMIERAKQVEESYVHTDAEVSFIIGSMRKLWSDNDQPAYAVATEVFKTCMGKAKVGMVYESATVKFQEWLLKTRKKAGLSYAQLAELSGVSNGAIHAVEHSAVSPSLDTAEKLCKALGTTLDTAVCTRNKNGKPKPASDTLYPDSATGYTPDSDC